MTKKDIVLVYTLNRPEIIESIIKFIESKGFKIDIQTNYDDGSTGIAFLEEVNKK